MKSFSYADCYLYVCLFKELSNNKDIRDCRDVSLEDKELKCKYK